METPLRLLLIEDSSSDEKLLLRELRKGGFLTACKRIETADAMVEALHEARWDLIISDYRLPAFSGPEALAILKESALDIPFIIVSGTIGELHAVDAMLAGANDYVMKDNMARLVPAIHRELADARIREEKRSGEAALFESNARFRNMADSAPVLLWMSDATGSLTYVNRQWLDFTGRSLDEEVAGWRRDRIHPDDVEGVQAAFAAALHHEGRFQIEYRMLRRDGQWRWLLDTGSPRNRSDGVFAGFIGTCLDLTDRKLAEMEHNRILGENYRLLQEREQVAAQQKAFVRDILYSVTDGKLRICYSEAALPKPLEPASDDITLSEAGGIRELRYAAGDAMERLGFEPERYHDLATAIGEAGMNAVVHAGGGKGRVHTDGRDTVQVWITDRGRGIDVEDLPRATMEKGYTTAGTLGQGMKMMLRTVDRMWLFSQPTGTTVVLEQDRMTSEPHWIWAYHG